MDFHQALECALFWCQVDEAVSEEDECLNYPIHITEIKKNGINISL